MASRGHIELGKAARRVFRFLSRFERDPDSFRRDHRLLFKWTEALADFDRVAVREGPGIHRQQFQVKERRDPKTGESEWIYPNLPTAPRPREAKKQIAGAGRLDIAARAIRNLWKEQLAIDVPSTFNGEDTGFPREEVRAASQACTDQRSLDPWFRLHKRRELMLREALREARKNDAPERRPKTERQARKAEIMRAVGISARSYDSYAAELRRAGKPLTIAQFRAQVEERRARQRARQFSRKKRRQ